MEIYLLRPAGSDPTLPGAHRFLPLDARQVIRAIGTKIRLTEEPSFDRVFTSPHPYAVQTAELFADRTDYVGVIEVLPLLASADAPPSVIAPTLLERGQRVLVVADEPALSALGAFLVGRPTFPPAMPGQISVIKNREPQWCLRPGEIGRQLLLVA